jgi:hypothetical protein
MAAGAAQKISEISGGDFAVLPPTPPHGSEPREEPHDLDQDAAAHPACLRLQGRHTMNSGTARPITATATMGLGAIAATHGLTGVIAIVIVAILTSAAVVIRAAVPEWYRLRALREPGRQMRWLITRTPSMEEAEKLSVLLLAAHVETVNALAAQPTAAQARALAPQHPVTESATASASDPSTAQPSSS